MSYVVGVDAGGTGSRALAVDLAGYRLGRGASGGANPNSHPYDVAAARIAEAISLAIRDLDPADCKACVVGMAGSSKLTDPEVARVFHDTWNGLGLGCEIRVITDQEAAFASMTSEPSGTILVAGTGSIASRIENHRMVRVVGGVGWLLGDEGSAYWMGREAVRAVLKLLETHVPAGPLAQAVLTEAVGGVEGDQHSLWQRLITAANAEQPIRLARFAPFVSAAHASGDPVATDIVSRTVDVLASMVADTRPSAADRSPVVLIGSVVGPDSPVGVLLRERLGDLPTYFSTEGATGAVWLAAADVLGPSAPRPSELVRG
ncbi:BadF/BadG/BcrA/BcrD ATPase family protein [Kibdelosporangium persicum]|uniref:N-acetylglucosamine kinase of eukaryotic type n=1 Tax=Kibdelosporangium persicum TaxID=2698649 RepID=A0ABX2F4A2_9PSEU|nr:BadF/BadG/BcrA/BcrD ATPase family protein [Kibdelosporangium persicum]NRN66117.1 N-acetylglucosamine kinase of eukaryotic type [Kibdelosporangium persicum]